MGIPSGREELVTRVSPLIFLPNLASLALEGMGQGGNGWVVIACNKKTSLSSLPPKSVSFVAQNVPKDE